MTARPLPFFKGKLMDVARDLYLDHGWKMPRGMANHAERNPTNFTLAEWQQAKRQDIDPRWLKATLQECWQRSDSAGAFSRAVEERGFFLAKGDRRGHVILDHTGEVYALSRALGLKTKEVRTRLGDGDDLPDVTATKKTIAERMTPAIRRHIEESRERFRERSATLGSYKMEMTKLHRAARVKLEERHAGETLAETKERAARLPKGLAGLWHRVTGRYQEMRAAHEAEAVRSKERQVQERQALIDKQREQRAVLQVQFKELRKRQAEQLLALRQDVGRYFRFARGLDQAPDRGRKSSLSLRLER